MLLAEAIRFLWVHFQVIDLCDAASDEAIREILEHLPEGLYDTYTRIFMKIAKMGSKATVLRTMMWMVCARRLLRVEELQEAVAFNSDDKSWNAYKIPDGDKLIKSCHGLVVRDIENGIVRLAHHTVQQYLVSSQEIIPYPFIEESEEFTARVDFWPELYKLRCDAKRAEAIAGRLCATYLCFSDFGTAVSRIQDDKKIDLTAAFKDRGFVSIPGALGLGKHLHSLPYKLFGGHKKFKMPDIDYSKYLNLKPLDRRPCPEFRQKFALLEYVIEYWPWHTRWLQWSSEPGLALRFWDLVQYGSLAFEFRPWGSNRHFGPHGCKGCPVPDTDDLEPKDLPSMALVHWAAETGHLKVFDIVEPPLQEYLKHERHHDETLLIACRHGQVDAVELLLARRTFDLSNGRAIIAASASGNALILERLLQALEKDPEVEYKPGSSSVFDYRKIGPIALYQAASSGHKDIVEILLARKAEAYTSNATTGLTPLQIAAKHGHTQVVIALCMEMKRSKRLGFDLDHPHEKTGMKALHYATLCENDEIVRALIQHGSGCNDLDSLGETALIKASQNGQAIVVKALLEGGADHLARGGELCDVEVRIPSRNLVRGTTDAKPIAVHHAASNGHDNVLALLPYSDWVCGDHEVNALHLGAMFGHPKVVQTLLFKGADIESKDPAGMTALHYASYNGHNAVVHLLLSTGCEINSSADEGYTALHLAAKAAKPEIIRLLVTYGAALDKKNSLEKTSLHVAASSADADTVRALVECGAPLEEQDDMGYTALEIALLMDQSTSALALIKLGAEWMRYEVFDMAVQSNENNIAQILTIRLSTATAEQQKDAAVMIEEILKDGLMYRNKEAVRIFKAWREREPRLS